MLALPTLPTDGVPDGFPYVLEVLHYSGTSVTLGWVNCAKNELGFKIERSTQPDFRSSATRIFSTSSDATGFDDSGLSVGTLYYYRVTAFNQAGEDLPSASVMIKTLARDSLPPIHTPDLYLFPEEHGDGTVSLRWTLPVGNHDGVRVEQSVNGSPFATIALLSSSAESFLPNSLRPGSQVRFRVVAFNDYGATFAESLGVSIPRQGGSYSFLSYRTGSVQYFLFDSPLRIERYDLNKSQWLEAWMLSVRPSRLWGDEEHLYANIGDRILEMTGSVPGRVVVRADPQEDVGFRDGFVMGDFLYVLASRVSPSACRLYQYRLSDYVLTNRFQNCPLEVVQPAVRLEVDPGRSRVHFGARFILDLSVPEAPVWVEATQDVRLQDHLRYSPDFARGVTRSGVFFESGKPPSVIGQVNEFVATDVAFLSDRRIGLFGGSDFLWILSQDLQFQGRLTLDFNPVAIASADADTLNLFTPDGSNSHGMRVDSIKLANPAPVEAPSILNLSQLDDGRVILQLAPLHLTGAYLETSEDLVDWSAATQIRWDEFPLVFWIDSAFPPPGAAAPLSHYYRLVAP